MQSMIGTTAEEVLVDRAARNDRDAFGALYDRHSQRVFAHSARQLGGVEDADDLTAMMEHGISHGSHQPHPSATEDEGHAVFGDGLAQG